ncbi:hypothetical protein DFP72DRAFT_1071278 [Ephemerocybe angulata]|uniref:Uncharacterized protein n=1 Tax=Ephemerocybe angulata TaxID=980116 RepID=A0A8H6M391_9AGAR|nr:hypothetical protein DFP72DRAFT_1071278 [Tulosesus angulatus]
MNAWLDGHTSICDPRYNDGRDRFPLCTLIFWEKMNKVIEEQQEWKAGLEWVKERQLEWASTGKEGLIHNYGTFAALEDIRLASQLQLRWDTIPAKDLAQFLGTKWLASDNIDQIAERVTKDVRTWGKVMVVRTLFQEAIMLYGSSVSSISSTGAHLLEEFKDELVNGVVEKLYVPFNINSNHW